MIPLLCLPFGGAGASFFYPWRGLGAGLRVHPVQLPGRDRRITERPYTDVFEAVDGLAVQLRHELPPGSPVALFGHSMGAVLAFELACRLPAEGFRVVHLVVSGSPAPGFERDRRASGLDDEEFLSRVEEFAGHRHPALDDPEMRAMLLPTLRADVLMHESYHPRSREPIDVPITAVRGEHDGLVSHEDLLRWGGATTSQFLPAQLPGGHMYLIDGPGPLLALVRSRLDGVPC